MSDYKAYREHVGIENNDMTHALHAEFPKYNRFVAVSVNHPDTHGVCLTSEAEQILVKQFGEGPGLVHYKFTKKRQDKRLKTHQVTFRMNDELYEKVMFVKKCWGSDTMQSLLEWLFDREYYRCEDPSVYYEEES